MKSFFVFLLAAALAIPASRAQAQNTSDLTLKGRTVNDKGTVVDYATVSVSSVQDSTKTYGTVGDDKGAFEVRVPRGDYRLKISFMGYENLERQIELSSDTDLGDLTMHPSAVTLDEVVVTGNIITREADRFIVNLANTPLAIGRDGKEIMSLAPGVWISEKGEISVNGRKGTRVMVNDRLLRETGEDLLAYLQNLKAEDILKIEVIPYAGAEYDADMTSGIIKITLKKQRNDGMEGSATMRYGHSLVNDMTWYLQPAVNFKYRNNKLSLYTDFSLNRNKSGSTVSGINQFHTGDQVTQTSSGKLYDLGSYKTLRVGGVYDIDDRQSVGLEVNYTHSPSTGNNRNDLTMQSGDEVTDVQSLYLSDNLNYRISVSGNYILNLDTLGSTFKLLLDYNRRNGDDHSDYHSLYSGFRDFDSTYRSDIITLNNIYSATADFDIALSKVSKLTTGIKYTNNGMDNSTLYEYMKDESWHEIGALTNLNKYNENISALYAKFSTRFKNNFALSLGLRGEYTYAVPSTSSTVITDKQNYFGLFPNANLSMPLNKKQSQMLILGYSRKIQRPWFWALNPFRRPLSEYSYIEGNPRLTPAYTNEVNLTWVFAQKYSLSFGTQLTKDNIQQILVTDPTNPDAIVYRFENMPHMNLWFVNLSVPAQITKWWQMTFNATGINFRSKLSGQPITIQNSIMGNMDNTFTIHKEKKWYIDLGGNYQSPIAVGNIRMGHYYTINGGLKHTFAKDRMTMSIYVNDIFNSGTVRITGTDPSVTNVSNMQGSFRRLGISLRYNFKAGKKIKVKNVQSGAGDEQSRLSGGASAPGGGN